MTLRSVEKRFIRNRRVRHLPCTYAIMLCTGMSLSESQSSPFGVCCWSWRGGLRSSGMVALRPQPGVVHSHHPKLRQRCKLAARRQVSPTSLS